MRFRNLRADEMECRVQSYNSNKNGCILLIYKDARCDMNLLDEVVGGKFQNSKRASVRK